MTSEFESLLLQSDRHLPRDSRRAAHSLRLGPITKHKDGPDAFYDAPKPEKYNRTMSARSAVFGSHGSRPPKPRFYYSEGSVTKFAFSKCARRAHAPHMPWTVSSSSRAHTTAVRGAA
jgi:hypothetical protein